MPEKTTRGRTRASWGSLDAILVLLTPRAIIRVLWAARHVEESSEGVRLRWW